MRAGDSIRNTITSRNTVVDIGITTTTITTIVVVVADRSITDRRSGVTDVVVDGVVV